jgi:sugar phosphate isomerase/epimerase
VKCLLKIGICNELFKGWTLKDVFKYVSELGYEGVEIAPFTISDDVSKIMYKERKEINELASSYELEVIGTHWLLMTPKGLHLTHPDENIRHLTKQYLCEIVKFTTDIGGKYLVLGSPQQRNVLEGVSFQQAWNYAKQILLECSRFAKEYGAVIALEPLKKEFTNFINTADEALKLIREVSHPNLKLHLDVFSMSDEQKPIPELIRKSKKYLAHFHANDDNGLGPGFGTVDYVPIIETLEEIKYDGFLSVEVFDFSLGPKRIANNSLENIRRLLAKTEKT